MPPSRRLPRRTAIAAIGVVIFAAAALVARADVKDRTPAELREDASHIFTGTVKAVASYDERGEDTVVTRFVAEIEVDALEKGEGLAPKQLVYVRFRRLKEVLTRGWVGPSGARFVPERDARVRAYVRRDPASGGTDLILPNGFEKLPPADAPKR
jgi:hypothetical protein